MDLNLSFMFSQGVGFFLPQPKYRLHIQTVETLLNMLLNCNIPCTFDIFNIGLHIFI